MVSSVLLFLNIGSSEMILIVFVALLLFGGEKLPEIARGLGKGIRDFKDASEGVKREINNQINSFEEKREEKEIRENILASQTAAESNRLVEDVNAVPNTMPVNDNVLVEDANANMQLGTNIENNNIGTGLNAQTPAADNAYIQHNGIEAGDRNITV